MYVDFNLAQETAQHVPGLRQWITNEFKHSGIRDDGNKVFEKVLNLAREAILQE